MKVTVRARIRRNHRSPPKSQIRNRLRNHLKRKSNLRIKRKKKRERAIQHAFYAKEVDQQRIKAKPMTNQLKSLANLINLTSHPRQPSIEKRMTIPQVTLIQSPQITPPKMMKMIAPQIARKNLRTKKGCRRDAARPPISRRDPRRIRRPRTMRRRR